MAMVPLTMEDHSSVTGHLKCTISSGVALDRARDTRGDKKSICEGENAGAVGVADNNNCWSIPSSWFFVIPAKILAIRDSGIDAGCLGAIFRAGVVWSEMKPLGLS